MKNEVKIHPLDLVYKGIGMKLPFIDDSRYFFGVNYTTIDQIKTLLGRMMYDVIEIKDNIFLLDAPSFRSDIWHEIDIVDDMISLSYKEDYFFWYIGKGDDKRADIAKRKDSSYFWIFDEEYLNGFTLKSYDPMIDIKLLQLYKLFDASLNATIFGEVDVRS